MCYRPMNTKRHQKDSISRANLDGFIGVRRNYAAPEYEAMPSITVDKVQLPLPATSKKATSTQKPIFEGVFQEESNTMQHFDLPRYVAPVRPLKLVRKKTQWRRRLLQFSAVSASLTIVFGGVLFWRGYTNLHRVFQGTNTVAALSAEKVAPELLSGEGDGRVNILMMGVGGKNHPGGDLTDTLMVLSLSLIHI